MWNVFLYAMNMFCIEAGKEGDCSSREQQDMKNNVNLV